MADSRASLILELKDLVSSQLEKVSGKMQTLKENALAVAGAFAVFSAGLYKTLTAAGVQENATIKLNNALSNMPGVAEGATARLAQLAAQLQKSTGQGDETIISMQALLATFRLNEQAIAALTPRILDISARMGIDMTSAALQLGKAIQTGEVGMLRRMGIAVDEASLKAGNLQSVIESLDATFSGSAVAAGNSITGSLNKLKNAIGDTFEEFGFAADRYLRPVITILTNLIYRFNESESSIKKWGAALLVAGTVITGFAAALVAASTIITPLAAGFAIMTSPAMALAVALAAAAASVTALATNFGNLRTVAVGALTDLLKSLGLVGQSIMSLMRGDFKQALENGKQAVFAFSDATVGAFYEAKTGITNELADLKNKLMEPMPMPKISSEGAGRIASSAEFDADEYQKKLLAIQGFNEAAAELEMERYAQQLMAQQRYQEASHLRDVYYRQRSIDSARSMFSAIGSIQASKSQELVTIVKAANIASAIMDTYVGANKALAQLGAWGFPVAAAIVAAGLANVATIAGVELAEGGMIMPRAGGVPAIMGEAGSAEVAIPLDDDRTKAKLRDALGGPTIIIQAGTVVADEYSVTELAKRIDKKLFELGKAGRRVS